MQTLVTVSDVCLAFKCRRQRVYDWITSGKLRAVKFTPNGVWCIEESSVDRLFEALFGRRPQKQPAELKRAIAAWLKLGFELPAKYAQP